MSMTRATRSGQGLGLLSLADAEHVAADLDAALHVAVQHPAIAAEHLLLLDAAARLQGFADHIGQVGVEGHAAAPQAWRCARAISGATTRTAAR
jgi:hypothetical protein